MEKKARVTQNFLVKLFSNIKLICFQKKEEIYEKVLMMRGKTTKIFTEKVTHLITTEVGSAKYHVILYIKFKNLNFGF